MTSEKKVNNIKKDLRKLITSSDNNNEALDILKTLETLPVNLEILSKTKIGFTVNKLRKSSDDEEIKIRAKNLIKDWRKYLYEKKDKIIKDEDKGEKKKMEKSEENKKSDKSKKSEENKKSDENKKKEKSDEKKKKEKSGENKKKEKSGENKNKEKSGREKKKKSESDGTIKPEKVNKTENCSDIRIKSKQLLISALKTDPNQSFEMCNTPENLAEQVEELIFKEFENTNDRYRNRIRSRVANLKDQNNPRLKENFLKGEISVDQLATMSSEDMASDELKESRKPHFHTEPFD